jgi:hypothetical protein
MRAAIARRRGKAKAQVAVARSILVIISLGPWGETGQSGEINLLRRLHGSGNYCDASD